MPRRNISVWSDYSREKFLTDTSAAEASLSSKSKYGAEDTPTVFPANSGAWMYYANHLEGKMPVLSERNTEYVEFEYREYDIKIPPEEARADLSSLEKFFGKTPSWWGDKTKDPLAQEVPNIPSGTSAQKYASDVLQQGGGKMAARFTANNGASYVMGPRDRLWLARILYGELRIHNNKTFSHLGGDASDSEVVMHAWMVMNLLMTKYHGGSLRKAAKAYSEALQGKTGNLKDYAQYGSWQKAKKTYENNYGKNTNKFKKAKRRFFQARNQYMANVAIWPGAEEFYSTGAHVSPTGKPILIPTKLADFVNRFAAGEIPKPSGIPGKIFDISANRNSIAWGSGKTYGIKVEGVKWQNGTSAPGFPYTDLSPPGFAFRKEAKGFWGGVAFRPNKHSGKGTSNNLYVRRRSVSEDLLRSISADKIDTGIYADGVPVEEGGIERQALFGQSMSDLAGYQGQSVDSSLLQETERQENSDQQKTTELPREESEGTLIKQAQDANKKQQNRADWINDLARNGWRYEGITDNRETFKNIFSQAKRIRIGGRDSGAVSMQNVVPVAASVQFGHRLAEQKLLGQKTSTFQFLGAGNKSGIIVLSAAGEAGRRALQAVKRMYATLSYNARQMGDFREASAAKINIVAPDGAKNNIFALLDINKISISNVTDEATVQDGVDIYKMTIEFLSRDFIEPTFKPKTVFSEELKRQIVSRMLKDLQVQEVSSFDKVASESPVSTTLANVAFSLRKNFEIGLEFISNIPASLASSSVADENRRRYDRMSKYADNIDLFLRASLQHVIFPSKDIAYVPGYSNAAPLVAGVYAPSSWGGSVGGAVSGFAEGALSGQRKDIAYMFKARESSGKPQWYVDLLARLAADIKGISSRFPLLNTPVGVRPIETISIRNALDQKWEGEKTWGDRLRIFGNQLGGVGQKLVSLVGGEGVSVEGERVRGFYVADSPDEASRIGAQQFASLTAIFNQVAVQALQRANDGEGFANVFGKEVADQVLELSVAEYGSCYPDLDLPNIANTKIKTMPSFFMYEDALESPGLAQINNDAGVLDQLVSRHLENSAKSVSRFIGKGGASKLFATKNADYLQQARKQYDEIDKKEKAYNGEHGAFAADGNGAENPVSESAKVKDAIGYRSDKYAGNPTGPGETTKQQLAKVFGKEASNALLRLLKDDKATSVKDAFFTAVVSSSYLNKFVDGQITGIDPDFEDENELFARARDFYFADAEGKLPDKIYVGPDGTQAKMDAAWDGDMGGGSPLGGDAKSDQTSPQGGLPSASAPDGAAVGGVNFGEQQSSSEWEEDYFEPSAVEPPQTIDYEAAENIAEYNNLLSKIQATQGAEALGRSVASGIRDRFKRDFSLVRAFPTFKIFFIDEDSDEEIGEFHAFDDFYSYSAVQEIRITRSRKIAADLAVLRITDVAHKLTRGRFSDVDLSTGDVKNEDSLGWWAETQKENPFNNRILREGVKVQIRLGYAPEPDQLETVFLGQITEVAPSEGGKILEIVCQGYGAELEAASMNAADNDVVYYSPQHALCAAILQPFIKNFGHWSFNQFYNPAQIRRKYHDFWGSNLGTIDQLFAAYQRTQREMFFHILRLVNFRNDPQDDNIFAPPPFLYEGSDLTTRIWNNANAYHPFMNTPWEVFKEHELRFPGYAALPLPYGHEPRMTMFFGMRGQRYWSSPCSKAQAFIAKYWTDLVQAAGVGKDGAEKLASDPRARAGLQYLKQANPGLYNAIAKELFGQSNSIGRYIGEVSGRYRPFRNHHIFTSDRHIIKNGIRTNASKTFNAVQLFYADDEDQLDVEEIEEVIESMKETSEGKGGVYTARLSDNIPDWQVRTYEDSFPSCVSSYMAKRYAHGLFLEGVKQSYGGELVVTGEETIKPYDVVMIQDHISDMYGPVEVESVTHIFNQDTGFVSVINPNMLVDSNDMWSKGITSAVTQSLSLTMLAARQNETSSQHRADVTSTGLSFDSFLAKLGAFHFVHWAQTASPVICTPLTHGGKPMTSMYTGEKYSAMFSDIWGEWHQWWEDFNTGLEKGAMSEEFFKAGDSLFLDIMDFFGHDVGI